MSFNNQGTPLIYSYTLYFYYINHSVPFYNTQFKAFCFLANWFCLALCFLITALFSENRLLYSFHWSVNWYVHSWMFPFFTCCLYAIRLASARGKPLCWSFHTCLENMFLAIVNFVKFLQYYRGLLQYLIAHSLAYPYNLGRLNSLAKS